MPDILPAIFFGHGNPTNALLTNTYTEAWACIGQRTRKPKAILSISPATLSYWIHALYSSPYITILGGIWRVLFRKIRSHDS